MTEASGWVPPEVDTSKANIARVYEYWLVDSRNFRADQDAARALIAVDPNLRSIMRANRRGSADHALARGDSLAIRQFPAGRPGPGLAAPVAAGRAR